MLPTFVFLIPFDATLPLRKTSKRTNYNKRVSFRHQSRYEFFGLAGETSDKSTRCFEMPRRIMRRKFSASQECPRLHNDTNFYRLAPSVASAKNERLLLPKLLRNSFQAAQTGKSSNAIYRYLLEGNASYLRR